MPVHPEPVGKDELSLRWTMPAGTLDFVGLPAEVPVLVRRLLEEGVLDSLVVEPTAIRTRLKVDQSWGDHGARVRTALATALGRPEAWRAPLSAAPADERLQMAARQVIDGEAGDYIRSHGGRVELLSARNEPGPGRRMLRLLPTRGR